MMHCGIRARWRRFPVVLLALHLLVSPNRAAAQVSDAESGLQGVPDEIVGLIIDTTSVYANRAFYTDPDAAAIGTYAIHQAKEMPWHHGYLRRRQRRTYATATRAVGPTAQAEVDASSAGRLRYRLNLAGAGDASHGSLTARGLAATNDFTQERGSRTETSLTARGGLRGQRGNADLRASWSLTSLNWRATGGATTARDRTSVDVGVLARLGSPERRGRTRLSVEATAYRLGPPSVAVASDDAIAEARLAAEFDMDRSGRPLTLSVGGVARRTEASTADSVTTTSLASVSLADRYAGGPFGVADWRASATAYANPAAGPNVDSTTELGAPFELGWTTGLGAVGMRVHGGYSVGLAPISLYADSDHVAVNASLPARTAWQGGASIWTRLGPALLRGSVDAEDVAGLPVWREEDVPDDAGAAIAWRPEAVDARLLSWQARLSVPRGAHAEYALTVVGEAAEPADAETLHLPYRPALTATGEARFVAPGIARVRLTAQHVGRRYRSRSDAVGMDGYTRFSVRVTRAVTSSLDVFAVGEAAAGTYQIFESERDVEWHALSQGGFGVGFTGRI
jgi:hypothetical protein